MPHSTLIEILDWVVSRARKDLLRYREGGVYRNVSSAQFAARVRHLSCFLHGVGVGAGDRVALLSENRPEWTISDFAIQSLGAINVPIYTTLSPEQVGHLVRDSGSRVALVSSRDLFEKIVIAAAGQGPLEHVVLFDQFGESGAIEVTFLEEAYRRGEALDRQNTAVFDRRRKEVRPEDLASIIYTSGTTGEPKGVMLTHRNFCSNVDACLSLIPFNEQDVALCFLPLSHVFERMVHYAYLAAGGAIAFAESFDSVPADLLEVRPTVLASVPRLLEKFHSRILRDARGGSPLKRTIFDWAVSAGLARAALLLKKTRGPGPLALRIRIADSLVFSKIRARMGGRVRFLLSGGAPLSREIAEFFLAAGIMVLEGYGLTETSPVIAVNTPGALRPGTVGRCLPGIEIKIAEDGEILVKGPNVMKGYFGRPEETRQAMRDGFFATGDIGQIDPDGFLTITDRKKDLLITSGGKNIAPQPIENALRASLSIANAVLIGDRKNFISALIVPDFGALERFAAERGLGGLARADLIKRAEVIDLIAAEIDVAIARFAGYEKIRKFALLDRDLTVESGELTQTLKVKRRVIAERYRSLIDAMYSA